MKYFFSFIQLCFQLVYKYIYALYGRIDCLLTSHSRKRAREERERE